MICPRCGAPNAPTDKFCAVCASPLGPPGPGGFQPHPPQGFAPPPQYPPQGGRGGPPQGYDMPPPGGGFGPPPGQPKGYDMPPPGGGYGPPPDMPPPPPMGGFGGPPQGYSPYGPPPEPPGGGYPAAPPQYPSHGEQGPDAFGATAYSPHQGGQMQAQQQPAPPPPGPGAMPPTNVMSGFDANQAAGAAGQRRQLAGFLVSFQDDSLGKFWPLYQGRNLVGRAETGQEVDVPIGHGTTSTNHATVECDNGRLTLSDLGSTNGTFHNEEAIGFQGRRDLRDGDKVRFGGFSVIVINVAARA